MDKLLIALIALIIIILLLSFFNVLKFEAFTTDELNTMNSEALGNIASIYNKDIMITPQLRVMGNANVEGSTILKGGLTVPAGKTASFDGDVTIKGKLNGGTTVGLEKLPDNATFQTLTVTGDTILNNGLTIPSGKLTKLGDLNIDGELTVNGNVIFPKSSGLISSSSSNSKKILLKTIAPSSSGLGATTNTGLLTTDYACTIAGTHPASNAVGAAKIIIQNNNQIWIMSWGCISVDIMAIPREFMA